MNSMPDINPVILQTPRADSSLKDKSSSGKSEFASLVENEYSKSTGSKLNKKDIYSDSATKEDSASNSDRSACDNCAADINNTTHNTDDIEPEDGEEEHTKDEADSGKGLKTGALLFSLVNNYMAEIGNASQVSTGEGTSWPADIGAGKPESESASDNGLKVGTLLNDLVTNFAAETGGEVNPDPASVQSTGPSVAETSDLPADNGLKVGTLLNNLVTNFAAEIEGGVNLAPASVQSTGPISAESSDLPAGNGLKVGTLLNNMISEYAAKIEGASDINYENAAGTESMGTESVETVTDPEGKNGLKIGDLLNRLTERPDEKGINTPLIKEEVTSAEKTTDSNAHADDSAADSLIFRKEMTAQAETKNEAAGYMEKVHTHDKTVVMDMPENSDNPEGLNSRPMSGGSDQFKQGNGTGDHAFNFAKGQHNFGNEDETSNVNSINTSNTALENARSVQSPTALHAVKTPGVQELLDNVIYIIKGNSKMGVSVEHENLGKLNISLSLEKGMVNVHINASDHAVREIIENNMQQIIDSLNKDGVSVGEFSVGLRDQRGHETNRSSLKNGQDRRIPIETKKEDRNSGLVNIFA